MTARVKSIGRFLAVCAIAYCAGALTRLLVPTAADTATNAPIPLISTNAPDPVKALEEARAIAFDLGVTYGALAARRNPDLLDATALRAVARQLLAADQRRAKTP